MRVRVRVRVRARVIGLGLGSDLQGQVLRRNFGHGRVAAAQKSVVPLHVNTDPAVRSDRRDDALQRLDRG